MCVTEAKFEPSESNFPMAHALRCVEVVDDSQGTVIFGSKLQHVQAAAALLDA